MFAFKVVREASDCFRVTSLIQLADTMRAKGIEKMRLKIKTAPIFALSSQVVLSVKKPHQIITICMKLNNCKV